MRVDAKTSDGALVVWHSNGRLDPNGHTCELHFSRWGDLRVSPQHVTH